MNFTDLKLSGKTLKAINACGYTKPTEVQEKVIPKIIAGANLVVRSQTGTGKTAAFGIGLVERIASKKTSKALILVPTRELAVQVSKELAQLGDRHRIVTLAVYGGQKITLQLKELKYHYDILVATPGRLQDLCNRRKVRLSKFNLIVLDEADHMLDIGFQKEVLEILSQLPYPRTTLLFSATIDKRIEGIISRHMPNSEFIEIGAMEAVAAVDEQNLEISYADKVSELHKILDSHRGVKTLIFVRTKRGVIRLKEKLRKRKIEKVNMLQGDMEQNKRTRVIAGFKEGHVKVLIATNVAARGLHVNDVGLIINFDPAENQETHLHRIGRTARMGQSGKVINLIAHDAPPRSGRGQRSPNAKPRRESSNSKRPGSRSRSPAEASGVERRPRKTASKKTKKPPRTLGEASKEEAQPKYNSKRYIPPAAGDSWSRRGEQSEEPDYSRPRKRRGPKVHEGFSSAPERVSNHKKGKHGKPERPKKESAHNKVHSKFSKRRRK